MGENPQPPAEHNNPSSQPCPLCHGAMMSRQRDPLVRAAGLALLYAAAFLFLVWLPSLHAGRAAALLIVTVSGGVMARQQAHSWCPACWFEQG